MVVAQRAAQQPGDPPQGFVAGDVAEAVVEGLEAIDVEQHRRQSSLPRDLRRFQPPLVQRPAILEGRHWVVQGDFGEGREASRGLRWSR